MFEADWSLRYAVNSPLLIAYQGIQDARQGLNMAGTYLLAMIILFSINLKQLLKSVSYFSDRNLSMYSEPFRAICVVAAKYQHIGTKQKKNRFAE